MFLTLSGWRRNCGTNRISDVELTSVTPSNEPPRSFARSRTYISRHPSGEIQVALCAQNIRLNGDYLVSLRLTEADIAHLAAFAFRDRVFSEVVAALSGVRALKHSVVVRLRRASA
jgi:hypothetical protein